jgi:hypothetical protein
MNNLSRTWVLGALLLFGAAGCADLEVRNPNDPDRGGALANPSDVVSLVSGSYNTWFGATHTYYNLPLSVASFQHSAPWANFGMYAYSLFPRAELINSPADGNYTVISVPWSRTYRAISSVASGLGSIEDPATGIADDLSAAELLQVRAFGKFMQGLSHATIAVMYDRGFIVDETTDLTAEQEAVPYDQVMDAAIAYFQQAIDMANTGGFTIPAGWMATPADVSAAEFAQLAHSYRAAYRASLPRTAAERSLVDWNAVLADINNAVQADFMQDQNANIGWYNSYLDYGSWDSWSQLPYFIFGMADQSDNYQTWLDTPLGDRQPVLGGEDILFVTPDQRFPQGTTLEAQEDNPGSLIEINWVRGSAWAQAARGTWRWSYYRSLEWDAYNAWADFVTPEVERVELDLLAAEANYWLGNEAAAASLVNQSREAAGLNATDAAGTNSSCVPRLPGGACGDLLEMIKWEKRMETWQTGMVYSMSWYFDSRRWDDHYIGTPLQLPIPGGELQTLLMPLYSFGGVGGTSAATGSTYAWPDEN